MDNLLLQCVEKALSYFLIFIFFPHSPVNIKKKGKNYKWSDINLIKYTKNLITTSLDENEISAFYVFSTLFCLLKIIKVVAKKDRISVV